MKRVLPLLTLAILLGALAGMSGALVVNSFQTKGQNELIKEFYSIENAVHVSPHSVRKAIDSGELNFILVDLRSQQEYEKEHIVGAINIPAYKDKDTPDYGSTERILGEFSKLPKDRDIIVYCYSTACMTGRKVGMMLAENGIYVKHLGVGWNEWRYYWNLWNHEHEWNETKADDYLWSGKDPGTPKIKANSTACPILGDLGC